MQTAKGIGDNGIWRIVKRNGILYLPDVGSKTTSFFSALRWYFRFKLSYRDLVEILGERGLPISHTTILRWVIRYAEICERRWSRFDRPVGGSWRVDETFIKIRGQWMYLYRAVDGQGNTVEFFLSRARGIAAAKAFFRKALKHHREPHSITLDGHRPSHSALRHMGMNGEGSSTSGGGTR